MGFAVDNFENLKRVLENSERDWCLVVLLDRVNRDEAARQMIPLLDLFDQKSGKLFDFYLPGYYEEEGKLRLAPWWRFLSQSFRGHSFPGCRTGKEAPSRLQMWRFDSWSFHLVVEGIEEEAKAKGGLWRYLGDSEMLLFQTRRRRGGGEGLGEFASYNLRDVVNNGATIKQFLLRICQQLETHAEDDWAGVKKALDGAYWELIMPPKQNLSEFQVALLQKGQEAFGQKHPEKGYVFISYSTKNFEKAKCICERLEKTGIPCWMAPRDIPASANYAYVIERAIGGCGLFLGLLSKESAQSFWCTSEISMALGQIQEEGRVHIAWLSEAFDLRKTTSGLHFALQVVQIDSELGQGDLTGAIGHFLARGQDSGTRISPKTWICTLAERPDWAADESFAAKCPWKQFGRGDWTRILEGAGERKMTFFEGRVPYGEWDARAWSYALARCPWLAERCDKWKEFSNDDWVRLLRVRPEFAQKCGAWGMFTEDDWKPLLKMRPELAGWREEPGGQGENASEVAQHDTRGQTGV